MAAVGAWPVTWAPYGGRGGHAGLLGPVLQPWRRARSPGPRMAAVGAWPVPWAPYGRLGGVAGPLGPVWLPWGRGRSPPPTAAVRGPADRSFGRLWTACQTSLNWDDSTALDTFTDMSQFGQGDRCGDYNQYPLIQPFPDTLRFGQCDCFRFLDRYAPIRTVKPFPSPTYRRSDSGSPRDTF